MNRNIPREVRREAFERFIRGDRAEDIGKDLKIATRTIYQWAQKENWHSSKRESWREAREKMMKAAASDIAMKQKRLLDVVWSSVGKYVEHLNSGQVNPRNAQDLRALIQSFQLLTGGPTQILEGIGGRPSSPFDAFMDKHGEAIMDRLLAEPVEVPDNGDDPSHGDGSG
jgi:hypothetical protein